MTRPEIRSYDYVNQPYAAVRSFLLADPKVIFRAATRSATDRAHSLASELRVTIASVDLSAEIAIGVGEITTEPDGSGSQKTRIPVRWEAAHLPNVFPTMTAVLSIYPLTATETQLDFAGTYEPPLGLVGGAMNMLMLHRLAEASVHRFVSDVAHHIRQELTTGHSQQPDRRSR
jgi:hypothetical protein